MVSRLFVPALSLGLALSLATPGLARDCQIGGWLGLHDKVLPSTLYVSPEDKAFVEGLGLPMSRGLFQGYGVKLSDVYLWFDENGCNQDLVHWVLSKARDVKPRKDVPPLEEEPPEEETPALVLPVD